ncbi:hypothetical protein [Kineococcus esterisolvens]|uniref:hypothetical protein n=1 Tax=unclassified Kineococcus TaxID=2621656 RepID=UPI003D7E837D
MSSGIIELDFETVEYDETVQIAEWAYRNAETRAAALQYLEGQVHRKLGFRPELEIRMSIVRDDEGIIVARQFSAKGSVRRPKAHGEWLDYLLSRARVQGVIL